MRGTEQHGASDIRYPTYFFCDYVCKTHKVNVLECKKKFKPRKPH